MEGKFIEASRFSRRVENTAALVYRGDLVESRHRAHVAVVDASGHLWASFGDPDHVTFTRSSIKAYQLLPLVASGAAEEFGLEEADLAVMAASHNGEPVHVERVAGILERLGLGPEHLQCGAHAPYHKASRRALEGPPSPLHNNCSGKHAGMLAQALALKAPLDSYLDPKHPVQQEILRVLTLAAGAEPAGSGVDGCSAPNYAFRLREAARLFAYMATPGMLEEPYGSALARIRDAMMRYPHLVAGTDRHDTLLMEAEDERLVCKVGGEAVQGCGDLQSGYGIFLKIEDGGGRAVSPVLVEALRQLQCVDTRAFEIIGDLWMPTLKNHRGLTVGKIQPVLELTGDAVPER